MPQIFPKTVGNDPNDYGVPSPEVETVLLYRGTCYYNALYALHREPTHLRPRGKCHENGTCGYMGSLCSACHELQLKWHLRVGEMIARLNPPRESEDPSRYWRRVRGSMVDTWWEVSCALIRNATKQRTAHLVTPAAAEGDQPCQS